MIPGSANPLLLRSAAATGYQIQRSLRFNSSDSAFCGRSFSSAGNQKTWSWSAWVKKCNVSTQQSIWSAGSTGTNRSNVLFQGGGEIRFFNYAGSVNVDLVTTPVFRDPSAWYHILVAIDTTQATSTNRFKLYVNGTQITTFSTATYPSQNQDLVINSAITHGIGRGEQSGGEYFDGYLADVIFIDGQQLTPSSLVETSATTGQLIPKAYTGSYGTNGFRLTFSDNSGTTATTLGKDAAGSNNFTPTNFSVASGAGNDSLTDTPTSYGTDTGAGGEVRGNYCTLNPLNNGGVTLTNGNLDWQRTAGGSTAVAYSTIAVSSGKWYFETTLNGATSGVNWEFGVARVGTSNTIRPGTTANGWGLVSSSNTTLYKQNNNSLTTIFTGTLSNGDIIGVAIDLDNGRIWFARNNTWLEGSPSAGTGASYTNLSGTVAVFAGGDGSAVNGSFNAGARPFAYTAPSGFKALCDTNLPTPVVAKPSTVMDVALWTGNGSARSITGLGFNPDLVWIKGRSGATDHALYDVVRGAQARLESNTTDAEVTSDGGVTAFNSDGFSLGTLAQVNTNSATYAGWAWDAGTTTSSNGSGSITSQVRANASAGFSIVTYTGTGANATVGHGLGVTPGLIIVKTRNTARDWIIWTTGFSSAEYLLFTTAAKQTFSNQWGSLPTSSVFGVWDGTVNQSGNTFVAYCFAPVAGYSSFGSYTGNGSTDGPFVFCNFRPRWILFKKSSSSANAQSWNIIDATRLGYNAPNYPLYAQSSSAEVANNTLDILSNGFKIRVGDAFDNENGATYIYAAFAESPFQYARAR